MVFTGESGEQAEVPPEMQVGIKVGLVLAVLAAYDPGFGLHTAQQAEPVVLMEYAQVGARCGVVAAAKVVVNLKISRSNGKSLSAVG